MRTGVRIGIDPGSVRVGVARSDASGTLAVPVVTLRRGKGDIDHIAALVVEYEAIEVLVGVPLSLNGRQGVAAKGALDYAESIAARISPIEVRTVDERLSTVQAQRGLTKAGISTRHGKSVIDQAAAVIIVQHALDAERMSGIPLGTTVRNL